MNASPITERYMNGNTSSFCTYIRKYYWVWFACWKNL